MFFFLKKSIYIFLYLIFNNFYLFFGVFVEIMKLKFLFVCVDLRLVKVVVLFFRLFMIFVRVFFRLMYVRGLFFGRF